MAGWATNSTKSDNFVAVLGDLVAQTPEHLDLYCIADNFTAHKTAKVTEFLEANPRVHIYHALTHTQLAESGRALLLHPRTLAAAP